MGREVRGPETGGGVPRSAHSGSPTAGALAGLVLLVLSPGAFIVAVAWVVVVLRQMHRHWWEWAAVAAAVGLIVAVVMQVVTGDVIGAHYSGYRMAFAGEGSWFAAVLPTVFLGVPVGVVAGASYVGMAERWAGGAEWHPVERHRR